MNKTGIAFLIFIFSIFVLVPQMLFAFSFEGIQIQSGPDILLNAESVENSSSPGLVTQQFGVSAPMMINKYFYLEPGIRLYTANVVLDSDDRPVLAAIETANRISMLNIEIRPEVGAFFRLTDKLALGVTGAPMITLRFPVIAYDYDDGSDAMATVRSYFFSDARFLSLYAGGFLRWDATKTVSLVIKAGTSIPVYHLWDGENIAFYNFLMIEPEVGFIFRF